ncbi:MBL fold metallo-hydrolase [Tomitella biformata]|uniref:MBL fold metallo-hydrolase n=1 Tax=Tomitella biformata TaxID=630403 RepID=UPI0004B4E1A1|nr:MBL fold metallo-hydrolase [Tomitella biformata]
MAESPGALTHPSYGTLRAVTPTASVLLCHNPGQMSLDGTNTWILRAPGSDRVVVLDPGPEDPEHLRRVADVGEVALTIASHQHFDHTEGLDTFVKLTGSPVHAVTEEFRSGGGGGLEHGEVFEVDGLRLTVLRTPGHTKDSVSLVLDGIGPDDPGAVLTADTILGHGTTVLDPQDGDLGDYLDSLDVLIEAGVGRICLPGHGPELPDVAAIARVYRDHRHERLTQVRDALALMGPTADVKTIVEHVYQDVDPALWPVAAWSVEVQLRYLRERA